MLLWYTLSYFQAASLLVHKKLEFALLETAVDAYFGSPSRTYTKNGEALLFCGRTYNELAKYLKLESSDQVRSVGFNNCSKTEAMSWTRASRHQEAHEWYKYNLGESAELALQTTKIPPGWNGENITVKQWQKRARRWLNLTEVPAAKQGTILCSRLYGAPARFAEKFTNEQLIETTGGEWVSAQFDAFKDIYI